MNADAKTMPRELTPYFEGVGKAEVRCVFVMPPCGYWKENIFKEEWDSP